jgi:hypothetical protein
MPLGVIHHLLVAPTRRSLHPRRQPVDQDRLTGGGHLRQPAAQVVQVGDERPVRLAAANLDQVRQQQVQAVADLALADAHHPPGPPVGQPVEQDRPDRVQPDLHRQWWSTGDTGSTRRAQVREAAGEPGQYLDGQR